MNPVFDLLITSNDLYNDLQNKKILTMALCILNES